MTDTPDKTILAFDYGTRRIGVAKSDPLGISVSPVTTLEVSKTRDLWRQIKQLIEECAPATIVVGYPELSTGERSRKCAEVDRFIERLAEIYSGRIERVDEAYTSIEAASVVHAHGKKAGRDKKRIDRIAAVIILQRYLEEQHG